MFFSTVIFWVFLASAERQSYTVNHCSQFDGKGAIEQGLQALAKKLSYSYDEFCANSRIADIYHEQRLVYHQEDDNYHRHEFFTLHYWEYSCEYQFDLETAEWADQYCYSTL